MIKLKYLLMENYTPALRLPDGEVVIATPSESTHFQIYDRLLRQNHPNVLSHNDSDIEDGWVDQNNKFLTRNEYSDILGYHADTFGKKY